MSLEDIVREGTQRRDFSRGGKPSNQLRCADGFSVSVVAGYGTYCLPRPDGYAPFHGNVLETFEGPYTSVEVGYPSERPEPWDQWSGWAESYENPTTTVYGYVPVEAVRALIALHGGEAE